MAKATIRVAIIARHRMVADGVRRLLEDEPGFRVTGIMERVEALESVAQRNRPDVVIVDLDDAGPDSADAMQRLRVVIPSISALGLASSLRPEHVARGAAIDAAGIYIKNLPSLRLVDMTRRVADGETIPPEETSEPEDPRESRPTAGESLLGRLTFRERNVLQALSEGLSTPKVGEALGISPLTVQSHVKSILAKLGVHSKIEAVSLGLLHGAVTIPEADEESDSGEPERRERRGR